MSAATALKLALRVALVTALFTMLGFAFGGFVGIVSISLIHAGHIAISMQDALWFGAMPGGVLGMITGVIIISVSERRAGAMKN